MGFELVGTVWDVIAFREYVNSLDLSRWSGVTMHHTATPDLSQRPRGFTIQHMRNLASYYRNHLGWRAGPSLYWGNRELMVAAFIRYAAALRMPQDDFNKRRAAGLHAGSLVSDKRFGGLLKDLDDAYANRYDLAEMATTGYFARPHGQKERIAQVLRGFPSLTRLEVQVSREPSSPGPVRKALSEFFSNLGDMHYPLPGAEIQGGGRSAAGFYSAAWVLDPRNAKAAMQFANLLRSDRDLDPDRKRLENFVGVLFAEKGKLYRYIHVPESVPNSINKGQNEIWLDLFFMHWALGDIFLKDDHFHNYGAKNPRSPYFQFSRAFAIGESLGNTTGREFRERKVLEKFQADAMKLLN